MDKFTETQKQEALQLYQAGQRPADIKRAVGCSPQLLRFWATFAGIWKPKRAVTPEVKEAALRRVAAGDKVSAIAKEAGVDPVTIRNWSSAAGLKPANQREKYNVELRNQTLELRRQGLSLEEIKKQLRVGQGTIRAWCAAAGIRLTPQQRAANLPHEIRTKIGPRIIELRKQGAKVEAIGDQLGISKSTVKVVLAASDDPEIVSIRVKSTKAAECHRESPTNTIRLRYLKARYNLTIEQYAAMEVAQGGVCAICRQSARGSDRRLHVDHDHATGKVRGLLCFSCNAGLGNFDDRQEWLEAAIQYLATAAVLCTAS